MIKSLDDFKNLPGNRPDFLYKYRSLADNNTKRYTEDIFLNNRLYHCATKDFNDPYEAIVDFRFNSYDINIEKYIISWRNFSNLDDHDISDLINSVSRYGLLAQKLQEKIQQRTTVLSLCEEYRNILMWSNYADSHRGICIEFDLNVAFEYWKQVLPMQYVNHFPHVIGTEIGVRELTAIYLSKSKQWNHEKEWRFINQLKTPGLLEFPEESISGIILGYKVSPEDIRMVKELAKIRKRKPIIRKTFIDRHSYSIGLSDIL